MTGFASERGSGSLGPCVQTAVGLVIVGAPVPLVGRRRLLGLRSHWWGTGPFFQEVADLFRGESACVCYGSADVLQILLRLVQYERARLSANELRLCSACRALAFETGANEK